MRDPLHPLPHSVETLLCTIHGKVQGVYYRHTTVRTAHALGVTGWVQNLPNGTVEALIQGTPEQIDKMLQYLHKGPPAAIVTEVATAQQFTDKRYGRFEQV